MTLVGFVSAVKLTIFFLYSWVLSLSLMPGSNISRFSVSKEFPLCEVDWDTVEQNTCAL